MKGDSVTDLLVSSSDADPSARFNAGAAYVVFGNGSGFGGTGGTINLSTVMDHGRYQLSGSAANNAIGLSVHSAGDVNGDGFSDLVIGMPYRPGGTATSGAVTTLAAHHAVLYKPTGGDDAGKVLLIVDANGVAAIGMAQTLCST